MTQTVASAPEISVLHAQGIAHAQLQAVRQSYVSRYSGGGMLPLLAAGLLLLAIAHHWPTIPPLWIALSVLGLLALTAWWMEPLRRFGREEVAQQLDRQFPELQDSTGLLLQNPASLPLLGQLQVGRVAEQLTQLLANGPALLPFSFKKPLLLSVVLAAAAALLALLPPAHQPVPTAPAAVAVHFSPDAAKPAPAAAPRITKVELLVTPPTYTRRGAFAPAAASFQCPQGAQVRWLVHVNRAASAAPVLEIGSQKLTLRPAAGLANQFEATQTLNASTLYRLRFAGQTSDDYAIDVRPDLAPTIRLQTPKPYTLIAARGTRPEVPIKATLRDDYGLSRAELVITVAQGQGEAVKFHEVRRDLSAGLGGQPGEATVASLLSLPKLGLTYGDELYFYVQARDSHGQSARSDAFIVQWQDTAAAASAIDMGMGVNTAPAYFRSERQIIIDTEKLIAEKPKLTAAEFSNRANALGFDQQSLRLRYGKFLGEEAEKGLGVTAGPPTADEPAAPTADAPTADEKPAAYPAEADDHDDHDHHPEAPAGRNASATAATDALMDPYMHKHDDAETADFLEPAVKAKLHAVLDEMWAAELRLRTGQPAAARPFEYRALRLLKQVQQQTRAYVKKAGFTPQPFPEATLRLTGELKGAAAPHLQATVPAPAAQPAVRAALRWLATQTGQPARPADAAALEQAGSALAQAALQKPGLYLPALRALRQLATEARASRVPSPSAIAPAQRALADLLPAPVPTAAPAASPNRLARRYFQALSR